MSIFYTMFELWFVYWWFVYWNSTWVRCLENFYFIRCEVP